MAMLSDPVRQWGLLDWNNRWVTLEGSTVSLYTSEAALDGEPIVSFDLASPSCKFELDASQSERLVLDNSIALIHLKFESPAARQKYVDAFELLGGTHAGGEQDAVAAPNELEAQAHPAASSTASGGAVVVDFDQSRYPEQLGKYWLGPIDPSRPFDDPGGSFGSVKAGVNSETGLKHPNIVDLKDVVYEKPAGKSRKQVCMIMELLTGGELFAEVIDKQGLSEPRARDLFKQVLLGMAYCHARKLVHRDIKLENLLLTGDKQTLKIADFGLAKDVSEQAARTIIGTEKYIAPEMLAGAEYDGLKSDMWSCGVCLYCMTECRFPFTKAGADGVGGHGVHQATSGNLRLMEDLQNAKYVLKDERTPEYREFLKRLLCPDVSARYTAAEALMDPWILAGEDPTINQRLLDEMDTESVVVPEGYAPAEWMAQVRGIIVSKNGGIREEQGDDDDDAF